MENKMTQAQVDALEEWIIAITLRVKNGSPYGNWSLGIGEDCRDERHNFVKAMNGEE